MYFRFYFILSMALCFSVSGIWAQSLPKHYLDFGFGIGGTLNHGYYRYTSYDGQPWIDEHNHGDGFFELIFFRGGFHRFISKKISVGVDANMSGRYICGYSDGMASNYKDYFVIWVFGLKPSYYFYRGKGAEIYSGFLAGLHNDTPMKYIISRSELKKLIISGKTSFERSFSMKKLNFSCRRIWESACSLSAMSGFTLKPVIYLRTSIRE